MQKLYVISGLLALIGLAGIYIIAVYFDPEPISLLQAQSYKDQAVTVLGQATEVQFHDTYSRGKITADCSINFIHFSKQEVPKARNTLFIGTVQESRFGLELLVEEIK